MNSGVEKSLWGYEIVERRSGGLWYSNRRSFDPAEWPGMHEWVQRNGNGRYALRQVRTDTPLLSASPNAYTAPERKARMITEDKARNQGYQLAAAFAALFITRGPGDGGALFGLARTLAAVSGNYDEADIRDAFIDGFMNGWKQSVPAQLTPPTKEVTIS